MSSSSSQVMALKWRPQIFADMVGQEHVARTLQNAYQAKRLAHAYIFAGPRGVGKTTTARLFAKLINCLHPKDNEPCNTCDLCVEVNQGSSLDVIEIDSASVNGVDGIRTLQEQVGTYPAKGKYKVYIFDEAHRITKPAFDAFLKTLEEPPPHVVFVMASTDIHSFPATVQSRCQRLEFRSMGLDTLIKQLGRIAGAEGIKIEEKTLREVARTAGGSMRDAQRTLDQLVAFAGNVINAEDVRRVLGLVEGELYVRLARAALSEDAPAALDMVRGIVESGKDLEQFYRGLLEMFRHLAVAKSHPAAVAELLPLPSDEIAQVVEMARDADDALLLSALRLLLEQEWALRHTASPSVVVETVIIELCRLKSLVSVPEALWAAESGAAPARPAPSRMAAPPVRPASTTPRVTAAPAPSISEPGEPVLAVTEIEEATESESDPNMAAIKGRWREILEKAGSVKKALQGVLNDCSPKSFDRGTLALACKGAFHQSQLQLPENKRLIEQIIEETANLKVNLVPVLAEAAVLETKSPTGTPKPTARPKVDAQAIQKDEPLVKAVMDIFDGKIVDVIRTNRSNT